MQHRKVPTYGRLIQAAVLVLVLVATTVPGGDKVPGFRFCLLCGERATADFILNVLLFMPLGLVQAWRGGRFWTTTIFGLLLSMAIEISQLWIPGRFPSLDDLLSNTLGAALGFLAWRAIPVLLDPPAPRRASWARRAALGAVLAQVIGVLLAQPALTRDIWFGQWAPDLGNLPPYQGRIIAATIGSLPVPSQRLDNGPAARDSLLAGAALTVSFTSAPTRNRSIIFSIADAHQRMNLVLFARGHDARLHTRTIGEAAGLSPVEVTAPRALPGVAPEEQATILVRRHRGGWWMEAPGFRGIVGPNVAILWREIAPRVDRGGPVVDVLFMALLFLPIGYWGAARRGLPSGALALLPALVLPLAPAGAVFDLIPLVGAVAGYVLGAFLGVARTQHSLRRGTVNA